MSAILAVDFDGTCVTHAFPDIGEDIGAVPVLKKLVSNGHRIILFTMRSKDTLDSAVGWFSENEIPLYGINENPQQADWTSSPKPYAHVYIDDAGLGIPLIVPPKARPHVDWLKVEELLKGLGLI